MFLKLYLISLPVFLAIDALWLSLIAKGFYAKHIGFLMKTKPDLVSAGIFYLLFIAGIVVFVISPSLQKDSFASSVLYGAFFGLVTYATYDLTNMATIKDWPLIVTVIDLIWGAFVSASVSGISFLIAKKIGI